jgi:hypothetical protein
MALSIGDAYLPSGSSSSLSLVVEPTPLKNMSSSVGIIVANIWENKKRSKPPTSY